MLTKEEIKEMVKQAVREMATNEINGVANVTGNMAGYDGPFGKTQKRKLKDLDYAPLEAEEDD